MPSSIVYPPELATDGTQIANRSLCGRDKVGRKGSDLNPGSSTTFVVFDPGDFKVSSSAGRLTVLEFLLSFPNRCSGCEGAETGGGSLALDGFEIDLNRLNNPPFFFES